MDERETRRYAEYVAQRATGRRFARLPASEGLIFAWVLALVVGFTMIIGALTLFSSALFAPSAPANIGRDFYATTAQVLPVFFLALVVSPALRGRPGSYGMDAVLTTFLTFGAALGEAASLYALATGDVHEPRLWRIVLAGFGFVLLTVELELILSITYRLRRQALPSWPDA
jgi:hypothetical protein